VGLLTSIQSTRLALPLRNANYGIYAAGNAVSLVGTWMQKISIGWLTWELTQSGFWLGIVAFADFFPVLVVGPIAGAYADRLDRLRVVRISQVLSLTQATVLCVLTALGLMNIGLLVALAAVQGTIVAFNQPARLALVSSLVSEADLASAVAINSIIFNLARFIGPMLAGIIIVWSGAAAAFAANALSYVAFSFALMYVRVSPVAGRGMKKRSLAADLKEGVRYATAHPAIGSLLLLLIAIGIGARPLNDLLPGFAAEIFQSGAGGLSMLATATAAGAIIGGLWLGHNAEPSRLTAIAIGMAMGGAAAATAVCVSPTMWTAVPALAAFGFCMSSAGIAIQTLVQLSADANMRGRVMGLYGVIFRGAPAVGALAAGIVSAHWGLRMPIVLGALIVAAMCLWTFSNRAGMKSALQSREGASRQ
jgi:MFS family permease